MHLIRLAVSCTCMGGVASVAVAASPDSGEKNKVEEVIVSARKMNERLQDVPVTITAVTGEQLEKAGAVDIKDVLRSIPGLSFSNAERGQSKYSIRGISGNTSAPTTGIYLNDISLVQESGTFVGAADAILFDVDRVEVLKGPQGTLYGGSAMGGAIKYVSAQPDSSQTLIKTAAGGGTIAHGSESYNGEAILNLPLISDVLAMRAGVSYIHEGGYIDNVPGLSVENTAYSTTAAPIYTAQLRPSLSTQSRKDYNFSDTYVGRLGLLWQPDPSWSIMPNVIYQDTTLENPNYILTNHGGLTSSYRFTSQETPDTLGVYSLDINKTWNAVELTSLTAYVDREATWNRDYSFFIGGLRSAGINQRFYDFPSFYRRPQHTTTFSQELRLSAGAESGARLRWVAGLYYSTQDQENSTRIYTYGAGLANDLAYGDQSSDTLDQQAAFGEVSYALTDALDITAGVRLFKIKKDSVSSGVAVDTGLSSPAVTLTSIEEDGVNPKFGLSYKISPDHLVYASAAEGFRPGGARKTTFLAGCEDDLRALGIDPANPSRQFNSDNLWSYEVGSKNEFGNGRAIVNGAIFYMDWKDIQQQVRLPSCGDTFATNAGQARVRGAELEAQITMTSAFRIGGNATYTDAKIVDAEFAAGVVNGDEVLDVPEWMASAFGSYSTPLTSTWDLEIQANYQYRGKQRRQAIPTQNARFGGAAAATPIPYAALFQEGYDVVNAFAMLSSGQISARLFVDNVLDEAPYIDTNLTVGISRSTTLRPRTIGFELRHDF